MNCLLFQNGRTDRQTDRQTDRLSWNVLKQLPN